MILILVGVARALIARRSGDVVDMHVQIDDTADVEVAQEQEQTSSLIRSDELGAGADQKGGDGTLNAACGGKKDYKCGECLVCDAEDFNFHLENRESKGCIARPCYDKLVKDFEVGESILYHAETHDKWYPGVIISGPADKGIYDVDILGAKMTKKQRKRADASRLKLAEEVVKVEVIRGSDSEKYQLETHVMMILPMLVDLAAHDDKPSPTAPSMGYVYHVVSPASLDGPMIFVKAGLDLATFAAGTKGYAERWNKDNPSQKIQGAFGTMCFSSLVAAAVSQDLNFVAPSFDSVLVANNKYYTRKYLDFSKLTNADGEVYVGSLTDDGGTYCLNGMRITESCQDGMAMMQGDAEKDFEAAKVQITEGKKMFKKLADEQWYMGTSVVDDISKAHQHEVVPSTAAQLDRKTFYFNHLSDEFKKAHKIEKPDDIRSVVWEHHVIDAFKNPSGSPVEKTEVKEYQAEVWYDASGKFHFFDTADIIHDAEEFDVLTIFKTQWTNNWDKAAHKYVGTIANSMQVEGAKNIILDIEFFRYGDQFILTEINSRTSFMGYHQVLPGTTCGGRLAGREECKTTLTSKVAGEDSEFGQSAKVHGMRGIGPGGNRMYDGRKGYFSTDLQRRNILNAGALAASKPPVRVPALHHRGHSISAVFVPLSTDPSSYYKPMSEKLANSSGDIMSKDISAVEVPLNEIFFCEELKKIEENLYVLDDRQQKVYIDAWDWLYAYDGCATGKLTTAPGGFFASSSTPGWNRIAYFMLSSKNDPADIDRQIAAIMKAVIQPQHLQPLKRPHTQPGSAFMPHGAVMIPKLASTPCDAKKKENGLCDPDYNDAPFPAEIDSAACRCGKGPGNIKLDGEEWYPINAWERDEMKTPMEGHWTTDCCGGM